ncbi:hypothetical protein PR003_g16527 [Phytophthora rubi]|uniref:Eukaryotic/viral aspartic protease n=1 Tax=Phytophthora rubi TaxID=129364 RepID=A0A6A4EN20_9STRA|nr:hypothetical protein PR003_g16527 [Phytophthora rubi]
MAKVSKSAVPATPVRPTRGPTGARLILASNLTSRLSTISERSVSFDDSADEGADAKDTMMDYEVLEEKSLAAMQELDDQEGTMLSAGRSGGSRSLSRSLASEFHEVAKPDHAQDDYEDGIEESKALVQVTKSPPESRGPAIAGRDLHTWKRKLRLSFGASDLSLGRPPRTPGVQEEEDSSRIPFPQTPKKSAEGSADRSTNDGVLSAKTVGSPCFQDSHVAIPRSTSRVAHLPRESKVSRGFRWARSSTATRRTTRQFVPRDDSSDDDSEDYTDRGDETDSPSVELTRQVLDVSEMERRNSTPRLELATHQPLAQIRHFTGARNKSENSIQWLRAFVYEMKGTHTSSNEWCMAFELSLRDGALHCFSQSAKARYYSAKREGSEHVCDYLNQV